MRNKRIWILHVLVSFLECKKGIFFKIVAKWGKYPNFFWPIDIHANSCSAKWTCLKKVPCYGKHGRSPKWPIFKDVHTCLVANSKRLWFSTDFLYCSASYWACSRRKCAVEGAGCGAAVLLQQQHHNQPHSGLDRRWATSPPPSPSLPLPGTCRRCWNRIWRPSCRIWSTLLILWSSLFIVWLQSGKPNAFIDNVLDFPSRG